VTVSARVHLAVPAEEADLPGIVALDALAPRGWSATSWRTQVSARDGRTLVVRDEATAGVVGVAAFSRAGDLADLLRVAVSTTRRREGIGGVLVREGLAWAAAQGAERMLLEVEPGNVAAVGLYTRLGFAPINVRPGYYGRGADALVMQRPLVHDDRVMGTPNE
jgi:ribosomal protein S18 acetylase RimI-like enzyme